MIQYLTYRIEWTMHKSGSVEPNTICPRSSDSFFIVTYYMRWVTAAWTHSMIQYIHCQNMDLTTNLCIKGYSPNMPNFKQKVYNITELIAFTTKITVEAKNYLEVYCMAKNSCPYLHIKNSRAYTIHST